MLLLLRVFIILKSIIFITGFAGFILGPCDLIFQSMELCDAPNVIDISIKQKKYNRTAHALDIILDIPYDLDEHVILELKASIKKQGGYKPGSFYMKDRACETIKILIGEVFTDFLEAAGTDHCPLPAGKHAALDFYFDNKKFTIPQVYGEYKMEVFIYKDQEQHYCSVFYYKLVPKDNIISF